MQTDLTPRLELARHAALAVGAHTLRYFQQPGLAVDVKQDASPVTVADREAEQLLREKIAAQFPDDAILGEEFGETSGTSGYRWILDPIDGTKSFIHGVPLYGVLIGVEHAGQSCLGVIHIPALNETAYAATGQGAWYIRGSAAPIAARVSNRTQLAECAVCFSDPATFAQRGKFAALEKVTAAARVVRTWGDAYGYLLVATGRIDAMLDPVMSVWDAAALLPVLQEAGGTYTDWRGNATIHAGEGIATNGHVLAEVLRLVG